MVKYSYTANCRNVVIENAKYPDWIYYLTVKNLFEIKIDSFRKLFRRYICIDRLSLTAELSKRQKAVDKLN